MRMIALLLWLLVADSNGATAPTGNGIPRVDPTENVQKLVEAAIKRLDDLRIAEIKRSEDLRMLDSEFRKLADKRIDDLIAAESRRLSELASLREGFTEKLREAEAKRIDAIRAVDVGAVGTANERATQQANVLADQVRSQALALAAQVTQSADQQRGLVASSAASIAAAQAAFATAVDGRLAALEKLQYTTQGGNAPAQVSANAQAIASLQKNQDVVGGRGTGQSDLWGYIFGGVAFLAALFGIAAFFMRKPAMIPQVDTDRPREPNSTPVIAKVRRK